MPVTVYPLRLRTTEHADVHAVRDLPGRPTFASACGRTVQAEAPETHLVDSHAHVTCKACLREVAPVVEDYRRAYEAHVRDAEDAQISARSLLTDGDPASAGALASIAATYAQLAAAAATMYAAARDQ